MARPSSAVGAISKNLTKAEKKAREDAEKASVTGVKMKETAAVKASETAHREFLRVSKLLAKIGKNDALYEAIINRYCQLAAECESFEAMRDAWMKQCESSTDLELAYKMQGSILAADKQVQVKRKMMLDIEKECSMTVAAALRSVPKTPAPKENPLKDVLGLG